MKLSYAINVLKSDRASTKKQISRFKKQEKNPRYPELKTNYEERINLCKEQIESLNEAIKILSRRK